MMFVFVGPGKDIYKVGIGGEKGDEGVTDKLYCQVSQSQLFVLHELKETSHLPFRWP